MKRSNRLVLLIGIFLAVVAFVGIALTLGGGAPGQGAAATPLTQLPTVIAARDIALGVRVTEDMLTVQDLPVDQRNAGSFQAISQVIGQTTRQPITSGAQLTSIQFSDTGTASNIEVPPGQRAVAVQVDQVSGVGTLIKTGDYVDMVVGLSEDAFPVVTINPEDETITVVAGLNSTSVKLLIEGLQVIGTLLPPPVAQQQGAASPGAGEPGTNLQEGQQEIVILSVSAQQAELIKFAQMDGDISLALRSAADFVDENGEPVVSLPAGTTGVVLKTLVDGGYGVLRPELVEAIIPAQ